MKKITWENASQIRRMYEDMKMKACRIAFTDRKKADEIMDFARNQLMDIIAKDKYSSCDSKYIYITDEKWNRFQTILKAQAEGTI